MNIFLDLGSVVLVKKFGIHPRIWFGEKDSDNFYMGRFNDRGDSYVGRWQWPGGGYEAIATKQAQAA